MKYDLERKPLFITVIVAMLVLALSFTSVAMAQEEQPEQEGDAAEMARRHFATVEQRMAVRDRDMTTFDDPDVRERWCSDDWIVRSGESLGHIVILCDIPLANILAANPQISNPDLVYVGEIINLPDEIEPVRTLQLTEPQFEYMQGLTQQFDEEGIPDTGLADLNEEIARRNYAPDQQRRTTQQRGLTQMREPEFRERWCDDEWVIASGESLGHIAIACSIPLDVLLAHNPQISMPDLVFPGEVINLPADPFATPQPFLTPEQAEYLEENFALDPEELNDTDDVEDEDEDEEEEDEDEDDG
jgi:LysM repeat protein